MSAVGLLASSEDQMNEALNRLIREPDLRIQMSSSAIRHSGKFDWYRITERWQELMELAMVSHNTHRGKRVSRTA